ncbi:MAG: hypothetical protein U5N27_13810 [Rhizobium sp.]|nr:hypothetical protein [Rhizobium sp.]
MPICARLHLFDAATEISARRILLEGLKASINVSNLFDKKHASSCIGTTVAIGAKDARSTER